MVGVGIFVIIYLILLYFGSVCGFSVLEIGLVVFFIGLFQVMFILFYLWFVNCVDLCWLLMVGLIGFVVLMYSFVLIIYDWGVDQLFFLQVFCGLVQQFVVVLMVILMLGSLLFVCLKLVFGLFNLMCNFGGVIGIVLCGMVFNDRINLYYSCLVDYLNNVNLVMSDFVQCSVVNFVMQGILLDVVQMVVLKNFFVLVLWEV